MCIFIYGDNENIKGLEYKKNLFNKINFKREYKNNEEVECAYLKKQKVILNIEGKELFIKIIKIPKVKKKYLGEVIKNEVLIRYGEDIVYNYEILEEKTNCFKIILYCAHQSNIKILQNYNIKTSNLIKMDFMQNSIMKYFTKNISKKKYILIVQFREYIYLLKIYNNKLISNRVIKNRNHEENNIQMEICELLNSNEKYKSVYYCNLKNLNDNLKQIKSIELPSININNFLKYTIKG